MINERMRQAKEKQLRHDQEKVGIAFNAMAHARNEAIAQVLAILESEKTLSQDYPGALKLCDKDSLKTRIEVLKG